LILKFCIQKYNTKIIRYFCI